jgi:hypothetical protein
VQVPTWSAYRNSDLPGPRAHPAASNPGVAQILGQYDRAEAGMIGQSYCFSACSRFPQALSRSERRRTGWQPTPAFYPPAVWNSGLKSLVPMETMNLRTWELMAVISLAHETHLCGLVPYRYDMYTHTSLVLGLDIGLGEQHNFFLEQSYPFGEVSRVWRGYTPKHTSF